MTQFAGEWYPANPARLRDLLERKFIESEARAPEVPLGAVAFVVPHAGIEYSGTVAAAAYRTLRASPPRRIVLLGFSHFRPHSGVVAPDIDAYRTPLGDVPVDREICAAVARLDNEVVDHSLEIQLPYLRYAAPDVPVVPLYIGEDAALDWLDDSVFVASSDFTHYGRRFGYVPFPVDDRTPERIRAVDFGIIAAAATLDRRRFFDQLRREESTMCGIAPVAILLDVLRQSNHGVEQTVLDYQASGEQTSDWSHTVSYACLAYVRR